MDPLPEDVSEGEEEVEMEDDDRHKNLMTAMSKLGSKGRPKSKLRSEPGVTSEYGLAAPDEGGVKLHQLLNSLGKNRAQSNLKKQLRKVATKKKTLDVPLYAYEAEKIQRTVAYRKVSKVVSKWDRVVQINRNADHISFPLNQATIGLQSNEEFAQRLKPSTPLENEVYKLLNGNKYAHTKDKELTRAEEEVLSAMSLEESQMRRGELQKARALQSYYEAKCKRQKRIKSKKYHRIKRKGKAKEEAKRMEEMMKNNPEEVAEEIMKLDKIRAEERMNLRHKNTGRWAKGMIRFGKYSEEARQKIADQLEQSRALTQKIAEVVENNEKQVEMPEETHDVQLSLTDINNPWFTGKEQQKEDEDNSDNRESGEVYSRPEEVKAKKLDNPENVEKLVQRGKDDLEGEWERLQTRRQIRKTKAEMEAKQDMGSLSSEEDPDDDVELEVGIDEIEERETKDEAGNGVKDEDELREESLIDEEMIRRKTEEELEEIEMEEVKARSNLHVEKITKNQKEKSKEHVNVDPKKAVMLESKDVMTIVPELVEEGDGIHEGDHLMNIQEAFEDDDVIDEFKGEKEGAIEKGKPKPVDLTLPGWGAWGGTGIKVSAKARKRFIIPAEPAPPRKDDGLHHVIINQDRDRKLALHQVNDLPFPFASAEQFERTIRAPIGRTWNTPSAVAQLTKRKVSTKMGAIIDPIQEEVINKGSTKRRKSKADIDLRRSKSKRMKRKNEQKTK